MITLLPNFEIIPQDNGLEGILKQINLSKICYLSEKMATKPDGSPDYSVFVERCKASHHVTPLEQGTVYLKRKNAPVEWYEKYANNPYSKIYLKPTGEYEVTTAEVGSIESFKMQKIAYITTNYRVLYEHGWLDDLSWVSEPDFQYHHRRITVKFSTQIAISREINRHRADSIQESSTRYCNYSYDKFGSEISISKPSWIPIEDIGAALTKNSFLDYCSIIAKGNEEIMTDIDVWLFGNLSSEWSYLQLTNRFGWPAERARVVLPLDTETKLLHTAYLEDWIHFFDLRCLDKTGKAHPDVKELVTPLYEEFKKLYEIE